MSLIPFIPFPIIWMDDVVFQTSVRKEFPSGLGGSDTCHFCKKRVYIMERLSAEGYFFHRECFRCNICSCTLRLGGHAFDSNQGLLAWGCIYNAIFIHQTATCSREWSKWFTWIIFLQALFTASCTFLRERSAVGIEEER